MELDDLLDQCDGEHGSGDSKDRSLNGVVLDCINHFSNFQLGFVFPSIKGPVIPTKAKIKTPGQSFVLSLSRGSLRVSVVFCCNIKLYVFELHLADQAKGLAGDDVQLFEVQD